MEMRNIFLQIIQLFSDNNIGELTAYEDLDSLRYEISATLTKIPSKSELLNLLPKVNPTDNWRLQMLSDSDETIFDLYKGFNGEQSKEYDEEDITSNKDDLIKLEYSISKNIDINSQRISIYDYTKFINHIKSLGLSEFISSINNKFHDKLILVVERTQGICFHSATIAVVSRNEIVPELVGVPNRPMLLSRCELHCQWTHSHNNIIPEDFMMNEQDDELAKIFLKVGAFLSVSFICDQSNLTKNPHGTLTFKISGFRSVSHTYTTKCMDDVDVSSDTSKLWYNIYAWCYTGGYIAEKLGIARNLISLNINNIQSMEINASTLDAIKSNFKIFERENVKQYIKVRNDLSGLLVELQKRINDIVDGFVGDFKKDIVAIYSFFLTVVVVRVLSTGDFKDTISMPVFLLCLFFVFISVVVLIFSRFEVDKKEKIFDRYYKQLKHRYAPLLSDEEEKEIFIDADPKIVDSHANYIQWQKGIYTFLWGIMLGLLIIILCICTFYLKS